MLKEQFAEEFKSEAPRQVVEMDYKVADFAKRNYGHAGKLFTEKCTDYDLSVYWTKFFDICKN